MSNGSGLLVPDESVPLTHGMAPVPCFVFTFFFREGSLLELVVIVNPKMFCLLCLFMLPLLLVWRFSSFRFLLRIGPAFLDWADTFSKTLGLHDKKHLLPKKLHGRTHREFLNLCFVLRYCDTSNFWFLFCHVVLSEGAVSCNF